MTVVVASPESVSFVAEHGGRLYVWPTKSRCCGAVTVLATASTPPGGRAFRRLDTDAGVEVLVPETLARLPAAEIHLELKRFPCRVKAYWDGCAWVV